MAFDIYKKVAENIKKIRKQNKLTQEQMAEKLNLDTQYYSQLERGERKFTLEKIKAVCEIFKITIDKIIEIPGLMNVDMIHLNELIVEITEKLPEYNDNQLQILLKYMEEILPLQK